MGGFAFGVYRYCDWDSGAVFVLVLWGEVEGEEYVC